MITYGELAQKFFDKGYLYEFYYLVTPPPFFIGQINIDSTREETVERHQRIVQEVYGEDWEHWSQWIDRQQYK